MGNKRKSVPIGRIYQLEMWPGQFIFLTPAELSKGCCKGAYVTYVFRPGKGAAELAETGTADDLLLEPSFIMPSDFTDGVSLMDTGHTFRTAFPFYQRHIFSAGGYFAADGEPVAAGDYPDWDMSICYVDGLTYEICRKLGLEPDEAGIEKLFRIRMAAGSTELGETDMNTKRAMLKISIPYDQLGEEDAPLHEVNDLADDLERRFIAAKLGTLDGDGYDALAADIFFMIKAKRYPEAVLESRRFLQEKGITQYEISGTQMS